MSAASDNLRDNQEQADRDGIMVKVSRQAVDETLAEYTTMQKALEHISKTWPDDFAAGHARSALAAIRT